MTDARSTQTLKFRYAQYIGNHMKTIFWPLAHENPNCTLCHLNDKDTWPHLLSTCKHPYLKGLTIARHIKAVHLITQTLQANKNTQFFTLTNVGNLNNKRPQQTTPDWLLKCYCSQTTCHCLAKLRSDNLCLIGAPNHTLEPQTTHKYQYHHPPQAP